LDEAMPIELTPHDLSSDTSHSPFVVSSSTEWTGLESFKAFDGGVGGGSYWLGTNAGVDWLQIELGSGNARLLGSYAIQVNTIPEATRAPKDWTMKGSNNGTDWTVLDTRTSQTGWGSGETRTFTISSPTTAYRYYRLDITANNGDATFVQVAELYLYLGYPSNEFAPHNMTTDSAPSPYVASASTFQVGSNAYLAFNGAGAGWLGNNGGADWVQIDLGSGNVFLIEQYQIRDAGVAARAPKDWTLKGSNNGSDWTTLDTRTNETGWGTFDLRTYTVSGVSVAYRYFRLDVSANNGDGTFVEVDELFLQGTQQSASGGGLAAALRGNSILGGGIYAS
jgi:hypothetical protein